LAINQMSPQPDAQIPERIGTMAREVVQRHGLQHLPLIVPFTPVLAEQL
jgi:hypothetical protein